VGPIGGQELDVRNNAFQVCAVFQLTIPRHPEGSVVLLRNLKFGSYYQNKLQLAFADSDQQLEWLISKADDSLVITKQLKSWFSTHGCIKMMTIDEIRRRPRDSMVCTSHYSIFTLLIIPAGVIQWSTHGG
jgi:hypothetical protein